MKRVWLVVLLAMLAGFAAAYLLEDDRGTATIIDHFVPGAASAATDDLRTRVAALEQSLVAEREARQLLEDELIVLMQEVYETESPAADAAGEAVAAVTAEAATEQRRSSRRERNSREARAGRLVEAGFDPARADWILRRESELQMDALQARYEAGVNGNQAEFYRNRSEIYETLRNEIGDDDYERFLAANGNRTDIRISNVIDSSPAQSAGLRPGDHIIRYDGERVFSMSDLTRQALAGAPGENVVLNITRDGVPMQVVIPRGPLGVSGG